jgi:hypothetical protein
LPDRTIDLVGNGEAGLWSLLARALAPEIDRTIIDVATFNNTSDEDFVTRLPIPGLRRAGDFVTAVSLAVPNRLLVHQTGNRFTPGGLQQVYGATGKAANLTVEAGRLSVADRLAWLKR